MAQEPLLTTLRDLDSALNSPQKLIIGGGYRSVANSGTSELCDNNGLAPPRARVETTNCLREMTK
jgi:hypothetical protein